MTCLGQQRWIILFIVFMLAGCTSGSYAPVSDRNVSGSKSPRIYSPSPVPSTPPGTYRVQMGDTLYSIAFRYGKDYKALAKANGIGSGYRIYPGQLLKLTEAVEPPVSKPVSSPEPAAKPKKPIRKPASTPSRSVAAAPVHWKWPVKGKVINGFSNKGIINKGINIAAAPGTAVHAAASGEVVYAGSGLLGYGNLIIIKHSNHYLSAYAHNSRILVKEKDHVKQSDKIAEVGNSGTTRSMLHFEIRKDGKPVNPMQYLP